MYLPHRVRGKLHVLKVHRNGGARGQGDDEAAAAAAAAGAAAADAGPRGTLESYGKVLSIEAFMKEDFSRYEPLREDPF